MSAPSTPQRPWRTRLLALTASTLVTVVACEALCRLRVQRLKAMQNLPQAQPMTMLLMLNLKK